MSTDEENIIDLSENFRQLEKTYRCSASKNYRKKEDYKCTTVRLVGEINSVFEVKKAKPDFWKYFRGNR